jgi:hypothetical protein
MTLLIPFFLAGGTEYFKRVREVH